MPNALSHYLDKLHHWSFDKGLFSIDDNYKMIASTNFEESKNEAFLPKEKPFRPSLTMIR